MNILMMTNTFTPHVGGVARSVQSFTDEFRRRGHRVVVVASSFEGDAPEGSEEAVDVVRVPSLRRFNRSGFSVPVPAPGLLTAALKGFHPDVIHVHHPFLLGGTGIVMGRVHDAPVVFTHHTLYEHYTQYMPMNTPALKRFAARLSAGFANLADRVFAPSASLAETLRMRGVRTPIEVVPTGVDPERFRGDGAAWRRTHGVPPDVLLAGHAGRLAPEKNLRFLARAGALFLRAVPGARFVVAGDGPEREVVERIFQREGVGDRLITTGEQTPEEITHAMAALDVFAFASLSETQGMVVTEAMACGVPVVALDGPGVRDVVRDGENGRLLPVSRDPAPFARALARAVRAPAPERARWKSAARRTARGLSLAACADKALRSYERLVRRGRRPAPRAWTAAARWAAAEWDLFQNVAQSAGEALAGEAKASAA